MAVREGVRKAIEDGDGEFLREAVRLLAQGVMEAELTRARALQPDGRFLYVVNESDATVRSYHVHPHTGVLRESHMQSRRPVSGMLRPTST